MKIRVLPRSLKTVQQKGQFSDNEHNTEMKKEKLIPKNRNVIVKPIKEEEQEDGFYLGTTEDFVCGRGEVLETISGSKEFKKGDTVVYRKSGQNAFIINGEKVHIVKEEYIDAIIEK